MVEGLTCRAVRRLSSDGCATAWCALGLEQVVRSERRGPDEDYDYRLFHLRVCEPPACLFVVK